ncbi:MAG: NAD(P)/FAD-dependent oxidoreductase [Acidimicrobiales bacterium]
MSSSTPLWVDLLTAGQRTTLDPGVPDRLDVTPDVLVVGGGVAGVATALACYHAGLGRITLVERDTLGAGATGASAGLLLPEAHHGSDPADFVDLCRHSLDRWRKLDSTLPGGVGFVDSAWLDLAPQREGWAPQPGAERLGASDVAGLIPELAHPVPGVLVAHQGRINPLAALASLAAALPRKSVATGAGVLSVTIRAGRIVGVTTTAGTLTPGVVMFATGGPPSLPGLDLALPSSRVKGHLIATAPTGLTLPAMMVSPVATEVGGQLLAGGTVEPDGSAAVDPAVVSTIRSNLDAALPCAAAAPTSHAWCGFRPAHPDRLPVIDRVPGLDNAWLTSGHFRTGVLMAPATGAAIASWIAGGHAPPEIAGLRADRF